MQYIVIDLEWNQAMSTQSSVFLRLPFRLRGEIIQIGAVKLTQELRPGEEFMADIKPVYFRRMNHRVKKITGFDKERLSQGVKFRAAFEQFRQWCGGDCVLLTWGSDDCGIMEQNLMLHDIDADWIDGWVNLQHIYNFHVGGDGNQKALAAAMEHFGIEQTRTAHDALGDAFNAALIASRLDIELGIRRLKDSKAGLKTTVRMSETPDSDTPQPLEHTSFREYPTLHDAFSDPDISCVDCPDCGAHISTLRWVSQGDRRYMTLSECSEHGFFLARIKFRRAGEGGWTATRVIYRAGESARELYARKLSQGRKSWRRGSSQPGAQ